MKRSFFMLLTVLLLCTGALGFDKIYVIKAGGPAGVSGKGISYLRAGPDLFIVAPDLNIDEELVGGSGGNDQDLDDGDVLDTPIESVLAGEFTVSECALGTIELKADAFAVTNSCAWGGTGAVSQAITRDFGTTLFGTVYNYIVTNIVGFGWKEDANVNMTSGGGDRWSYDIGSATGKINETAANDLEEVGTAVNYTSYQIALSLGGYDSSGVPYQTGDTAANFKYGCSYWLKGGTYTDWTLLWKDDQQNTATMYAAFGSASAIYTVADIIVPGETIDVDTMFNPAYISTTPDNNAHDIGTGDAIINANVTTPGAGVSDFYIRFRLQDANNYWNVKMLSGTAGNDLTLHKTTGGIEAAAVASSDQDFAVGTAFDIRIICDGSTHFAVYVDGIRAFTYTGPDTDFEDETEIQLVDSGAAFTENRLAAWPRTDSDWGDEISSMTITDEVY